MEKTVERVDCRDREAPPVRSSCRYERLEEAAEATSFLLNVYLREMKRLRMIEGSNR